MVILEGVRVADFTRVVAGPYCTMTLGDMGAEVIKLEQPEVGDDVRHLGPPFAGEDSAYFMFLNRNKLSVTVDLSTVAGRERARRIVEGCDVLVENFRRGYMESIGLGYEQLASRQPGLIYCSITGYGDTGPYRDRAGYDVMIAARGGLLSITGHPGQPPVKVGVAMTDLLTGMHACTGILAALRHRERTGEGQRIEVSLLGVQVAALLNAAAAYLIGGTVMEPMGNAHPQAVPYQAYRCADGWLLLGAANDKMFRATARCLGRPEWADDPRFTTNSARIAHRELLNQLIEEVLSTGTVEAWDVRLSEAGVAVAPVNRIDQVFADPQVRHLGLVTEVAHPTAGLIPQVRSPLNFSRTPVCIRRPPPRLGEHDQQF